MDFIWNFGEHVDFRSVFNQLENNSKMVQPAVYHKGTLLQKIYVQRK